MLKFLKSLAPARKSPLADEAPEAEPPHQISMAGAPPLDLGPVLKEMDGFPMMDWAAVGAWMESLPLSTSQADAWALCERAWLAHMRMALGPNFRLRSQGSAILLSSLPDHVAIATLTFINKTVQRIVRALEGVAASPVEGHDILIVFDDEDSYYRYVSRYYHGAGEFAASSGMYLHDSCGHFVTVKADLHAVEPVIAHELTHACLGHLPIPAWLNEGLAVNVEHRLCPPQQLPRNPLQRHVRHRRFWGPAEIQEFWSGQAFFRNDEGNELSYDLARILVTQFAVDWGRFREFVVSANLADGAASAAQAKLGISLGAAVCAVLEREPDAQWEPQPQTWAQPLTAVQQRYARSAPAHAASQMNG